MFAGRVIDAAFSMRFEGIQAKRDQFNQDFKDQIEQLGGGGFRPFSQPDRGSQASQAWPPAESMGQVRPRLLENLTSGSSTARKYRDLRSPAAGGSLPDGVAESAKRLPCTNEGLKAKGKGPKKAHVVPRVLAEQLLDRRMREEPPLNSQSMVMSEPSGGLNLTPRHSPQRGTLRAAVAESYAKHQHKQTRHWQRNWQGAPPPNAKIKMG